MHGQVSSSLMAIEYTPLSIHNLTANDSFESVRFSVSHRSHCKTVRLLKEHTLIEGWRLDLFDLLPSELWGLARVLSQRYGRLNEVAVTGSMWEIYGTACPEALLQSRSVITHVAMRCKLSIATVQTETCNSDGNVLFRAKDTLLLIHDLTLPFYHERVHKDPNRRSRRLLFHRKQCVYFRHTWDPALWINNVHTDDFAQRCGYERALPEFIMYMDWVWRAVVEVVPDRVLGGLRLTLQRILPLYLGEIIDVLVYEEEDHFVIRFLRNDEVRVIAEAFLL